jgi:hypothetical protein
MKVKLLFKVLWTYLIKNIMETSNVKSYVPYKQQQKNKRDRQKLIAGGLTLTGAGALANYKLESREGQKKVDKNIASRVEKYKAANNSALRKDIGAVKKETEARIAELKSKANNAKIFKAHKIKSANKKAAQETDLMNKRIGGLKEEAARRSSRYEARALKVAKKTKRTIKSNAGNKALGIAAIGTGITLGAAQVMKRKQKQFGFLGDLRNNLADRLFNYSIKLGERTRELEREINKINNTEESLLDRLTSFANSLGVEVVEVSGNRSYQKDNKIFLAKGNALALAHELGHYLNTVSTSRYNKFISNTNNTKSRDKHNKFNSIYDGIKLPRAGGLVNNENFKASKLGNTKTGKYLNNLISNETSRAVVVLEESNATRNGLILLKEFNATEEDINNYIKRFRLAINTYKTMISRNRYGVLSELIRPKTNRIDI